MMLIRRASFRDGLSFCGSGGKGHTAEPYINLLPDKSLSQMNSFRARGSE